MRRPAEVEHPLPLFLLHRHPGHLETAWTDPAIFRRSPLVAFLASLEHEPWPRRKRSGYESKPSVRRQRDWDPCGSLWNRYLLVNGAVRGQLTRRHNVGVIWQVSGCECRVISSLYA
jgi:hypothetical protein